MFTLINFNTLDVWVLVCHTIFMDTAVNSNHIVMADIVTIALCWQMLCLGYVTDVITTLCCSVLWQMESHYGRCYSPVC